MRETNFYGLNLWDLTDRIQMEDFNRDNEKLDAALRALALSGGSGGGGATAEQTNKGTPDSTTPYLEVGSYIFGRTVPSRWNEYSLVLLMGEITPEEEGTTPFVWVGDISGTPDVIEEESKFDIQPGGFLYLLLPMKNEENLMQGVFISGGNVRVVRGTMPFSQVNGFMACGRKADGEKGNVWVKKLRSVGLR